MHRFGETILGDAPVVCVGVDANTRVRLSKDSTPVSGDVSGIEVLRPEHSFCAMWLFWGAHGR